MPLQYGVGVSRLRQLYHTLPPFNTIQPNNAAISRISVGVFYAGASLVMASQAGKSRKKCDRSMKPGARRAAAWPKPEENAHKRREKVARPKCGVRAYHPHLDDPEYLISQQRYPMAAQFGTKAETLAMLENRIKNARILPQHCFTASQWRQTPKKVLKRLLATPWSLGPLIVRSSAQSEDTDATSMAGHFTSVGNVVSRDGLSAAIEQVMASFPFNSQEDQIFVQPFLTSVQMSGVAFTRDPNNGGHYYVINYDADSGGTDSVTSGSGQHLQTRFLARNAPSPPPEPWGRLLLLLQELETLFDRDALDVEFAVASTGDLYLFQVRSLHRAGGFLAHAQEHQQVLQ
ncbi:MAG: hypothetical protein HQL62_01465, partial [Magnetococcales bacterium]|nr:hypothetical protein [Magnetococcales bacterium]